MATSGLQPEAFRWTSLPAEIRSMILKNIARQDRFGRPAPASVSREWQGVLEHANFEKLKLRMSRLDDFERIASPPRRSMIRHISLDIELPPYTCDDCGRRSSKLFSILSAWEPAGDLALELHVYSPSDRDHWFKEVNLSTDDLEEDEWDDDEALDDWREGFRCHDPPHGWLLGQQTMNPPRSAILRLFQPMTLRFQRPLPEVRAVTRFIMRRQLRRHICPFGIRLMLNSLVRVEHMAYEPWAVPLPAERQIHEQGLAMLVGTGLPGSLKSLTIFEDSYRRYNRFSRRMSDGPWINLFLETLRLGAMFASRSRGLQHLCISFMVNAEDVFRNCQPAWNWPHLQTLALTSNFLRQDEKFRPYINMILRRAGALAQRMPELNTFVLWNGGRGHACAFIYRVEEDGASITWRGTWRLVLSEDPLVLQVWGHVAARRKFSRLQIRQQRIFRYISSHGDAVHRLELPCQVVEPASVWQIRREAFRPAR
ncbi:hypothetical protein V8C44DRAFT_353123 [Trichoderma aethiopicum]